MAFTVTLLALALIFLGLSFIVLNGIGGRASDAEYALVIDAGSSGSRIHLYKWLPEDDDRIPIITELRLDKKCDETKPGLSKFDGSDKTLPTISESLALLITCAKLELTDRIANFQKVRLYLMATAGMRIKELLHENEYNKIMVEVRTYLKNAPFDYRDPITIRAKKEALYAWIAANYLNGSLGRASNKETIGILELGGASAQIAFVHSKGIELVKIGGRPHRVYAKGYDGVGKKEFIEAFKGGNLCDPKIIYIIPSGGSDADKFNNCQEKILDHFYTAEKNTVFNELLNTDFPNHDNKFLAISNFNFTPSFFGQYDMLDYDELNDAGSKYCVKSWKDIRAENKKVAEEFLREYCLMAAYIPVLLNHGFRVTERDKNNELRVRLRLKGSKADVDWTLGALICSLYDCRSES